jgi:hypothetical protein
MGDPKDSKFPLLGVRVSSSHLPQSGVMTLSLAHHHGGPDTRLTLLQLTQVEEYVNSSCPKLWQNLEYLKKKLGITHAIKSHNKGIHLNDPIPKFQFTWA